MLFQHELNPEPVENVLEGFWTQTKESSEEVKRFAESMVRGTLSRLEQIDRVITQYAENWQLNRMAAIDRNILRFATYELLYCQDIPPKVTINEAVNIAKKFSQEDSGKFVNGILDRISHAEGNRTSPSGADA